MPSVHQRPGCSSPLAGRFGCVGIFRSRKRTRVALVVGVTVAVAGTGTAAAQAAIKPAAPSFSVTPDSFSGHGTVTGNVLRNDHGATAVVQNTSPADGTVTVNADGTFSYTPKAGFKGRDILEASVRRLNIDSPPKKPPKVTPYKPPMSSSPSQTSTEWAKPRACSST